MKGLLVMAFIERYKTLIFSCSVTGLIVAIKRGVITPNSSG